MTENQYIEIFKKKAIDFESNILNKYGFVNSHKLFETKIEVTIKDLFRFIYFNSVGSYIYFSMYESIETNSIYISFTYFREFPNQPNKNRLFFSLDDYQKDNPEIDLQSEFKQNCSFEIFIEKYFSILSELCNNQLRPMLEGKDFKNHDPFCGQK